MRFLIIFIALAALFFSFPLKVLAAFILFGAGVLSLVILVFVLIAALLES